MDAVHRSDGAAAVLADLAVLLAAATAVGIGAAAGPVAGGGVLTLWSTQRYASREPLETQGVLWYAALAAGPYAAFMLAVVAAGPALGAERDVLAATAFAGAAGLVGLRLLTWTALVLARCHGVGLRPVLVVGDGPVAATTAKKLRDNPAAGLRPVGIASPTGDELGDGAGFAARPDDLPAVVRRHGVMELVVVLDGTRSVDIAACLHECADLDLRLLAVPPMSDLFLRPEHVAQVAGLALLPLGFVHRTEREAAHLLRWLRGRPAPAALG